MKMTIPLLALATLLAAPVAASARPVGLNVQLKNYGGDGAYVVVYLAKAGQYEGTLWMAGTRQKYYRHLRDWVAVTGGSGSEIDGITGASVGSGRSLTVTVDVADALIDAGYEVRIDTAVENMRENPGEIVVPLTTDGAGLAIHGRGYVESFTYQF